jgi:alkylation response protein AidB-like acyl-CoA dehydrogenase
MDLRSMSLCLRDTRRLREAAAIADAAGMLHPVQQALLHRRGWLKMLAPRACGGAELPLPAAVRLQEDIAAADGSCGWIVTLCAGAGWFAGFLPPDLARAIVGTRRVCLAGSGAASGFADGDGAGFRIDGLWAHASGAPMATHFTFNAVLREGGKPLLDGRGVPRVRAFVIPAADVEITSTWQGIGLRAAASHAFRIRDRWVPEHHGFDIDAAAATASGALYRFPFATLAIVTLAVNVAAMARHFLEAADPVVRERRLWLTGGRLGDSPVMRKRLQDVQEAIGAARARFYLRLDAAWQDIEAGIDGRAPDMQALQAAAFGLANAARCAADEIYPLCGLHAADVRSDLNRIWRDLHTATQHALLVTL